MLQSMDGWRFFEGYMSDFTTFLQCSISHQMYIFSHYEVLYNICAGWLILFGAALWYLTVFLSNSNHYSIQRRAASETSIFSAPYTLAMLIVSEWSNIISTIWVIVAIPAWLHPGSPARKRGYSWIALSTTSWKPDMLGFAICLLAHCFPTQ